MDGLDQFNVDDLMKDRINKISTQLYTILTQTLSTNYVSVLAYSSLGPFISKLNENIASYAKSEPMLKNYTAGAKFKKITWKNLYPKWWARIRAKIAIDGWGTYYRCQPEELRLLHLMLGFKYNTEEKVFMLQIPHTRIVATIDWTPSFAQDETQTTKIEVI